MLDGHIEPPTPTTRPKMKNRSSTVKPGTFSEAKGKGKGKAAQWDSDDDKDDAYVTSNDSAGTPEPKHSSTNGAFGDVGDDDEEMYG